MCKSCDFVYVEGGNLYLEEQGRDASLPSKWTRQKPTEVLNIYLFLMSFIFNPADKL